jgi:hypothetical protein
MTLLDIDLDAIALTFPILILMAMYYPKWRVIGLLSAALGIEWAGVAILMPNMTFVFLVAAFFFLGGVGLVIYPELAEKQKI